jgi:Family of unknown function (DUF6131)
MDSWRPVPPAVAPVVAQTGGRLADRVGCDEYPQAGRDRVITLGIVLIILALIVDSAILWVLGGILAVLGVIFWILGAIGRAVGGRRHYY